jgi:hypothetical protein
LSINNYKVRAVNNHYMVRAVKKFLQGESHQGNIGNKINNLYSLLKR